MVLKAVFESTGVVYEAGDCRLIQTSNYSALLTGSRPSRFGQGVRQGSQPEIATAVYAGGYERIRPPQLPAPRCESTWSRSHESVDRHCPRAKHWTWARTNLCGNFATDHVRPASGG
jgi:hypothetical protein